MDDWDLISLYVYEHFKTFQMYIYIYVMSRIRDLDFNFWGVFSTNALATIGFPPHAITTAINGGALRGAEWGWQATLRSQELLARGAVRQSQRAVNFRTCIDFWWEECKKTQCYAPKKPRANIRVWLYMNICITDWCITVLGWAPFVFGSLEFLGDSLVNIPHGNVH